MDERIMQFRVGVVVLAVALIAAFLTLLFSHSKELIEKTYTIYILFPQSPGVAAETPVRKNGVLIGRVTQVDLEDQQRRVRVTAAIYEKYTIWNDEIIRINSTLLGDAELDVVPANPGGPASNVAIKPGETITGVVTNNPLQVFANLEKDFGNAARSLDTAGSEVAQLSHHLDQLIGSDNGQFSRLMNKTETSLDALKLTLDSVNSVVGDEKTRDALRQSITDLPGMLRQTQDALTLIQKTSARADRNLQNLESFTKPLGEKGESLINNADQSVRKLDELLGQMDDFTRQLNSRDSSLGQLTHSRQLYDQLNSAATNINELSRELKPVISDARVLSDKLARHPEDLGIGGALHRSPGTK